MTIIASAAVKSFANHISIFTKNSYIHTHFQECHLFRRLLLVAYDATMLTNEASPSILLILRSGSQSTD